MKCYEYRFEFLKLVAGKRIEEQILDTLSITIYLKEWLQMRGLRHG